MLLVYIGCIQKRHTNIENAICFMSVFVTLVSWVASDPVLLHSF